MPRNLCIKFLTKIKNHFDTDKQKTIFAKKIKEKSK